MSVTTTVKMGDITSKIDDLERQSTDVEKLMYALGDFKKVNPEASAQLEQLVGWCIVPNLVKIKNTLLDVKFGLGQYVKDIEVPSPGIFWPRERM